jgi:osmotically inducible lipoprotein OsmB
MHPSWFASIEGHMRVRRSIRHQISGIRIFSIRNGWFAPGNHGHASQYHIEISGRCQGKSLQNDADLLLFIVGKRACRTICHRRLSLAVLRKRVSMSRHIIPAFVLLGCGLTLVACGYSPGDRAVSGGLIGAGGGAAIGAVTGGSPLTGALIGGAVGAVAGGVSSPNSVNLGRPVWR